MSAKELTLEGQVNRMRVNDMHDKDDSVVVHINNHPVGRSGMMAILDRGQQHLLLLYLQERLEKS